MSTKFLLTSLGLVVFVSSLFFFGISRIGKTGQSVGCPALTFSGEVDPSDTVAFWHDSTLVPPLALNDSLTDAQKKSLGSCLW